jgi:hypothetical protein
MNLSNISRSISSKISRNISHKIQEAPTRVLNNTSGLLIPPTGALAVWDVTNYSATPVPHIKPIGSSATVDPNILRTGIRLLTVAATNATRTANYADGWDGSTLRAMRLLATPGVWDFSTHPPGATLYLTAGTYTLSFYVKSNTGSSQDFRCGIQTGYSGLETRTATTSWAKVEVSITLASLATNRYAWLAVPVNSGVDSLDILIDDVRVESGASTATPTEAGIIYLGRQPQGTSVPTVTGGAVTMQTGKPLSAHFASSTTFTNMTISAYVKKTGASAVATGIIGKFGSDYIGAMIEDSSGINVYAGQTTAPRESIPVTMGNILNDGYHLITVTRDNTYVWLYLDDIPLGRQAHGGAAATQVRDWIINDQVALTNNLFFGGDVALWGLWDRAITHEEVASLREYCKAQRVANGDTAGTISNLICYVGDSISSIKSYSFAYPTKVTPSEKAYAMVQARAGYRISNIVADAAWIDSCLAHIPSDTTRNNILTSFIGANGLTTEYGTQAEWEAAYLAWGQARRAAGWKWAPATILPISGATAHNTRRALVNATILSWLGLGYCDAVIDVASDATIGPDAAAANVTYYSDGTHLTNAGQTIAAPYFQTAINSLL